MATKQPSSCSSGTQTSKVSLAYPASIIRASKKDELYLQSLRDQCFQTVSGLFGTLFVEFYVIIMRY